MLADPSALAPSRRSSRPPICFNSHSTHPSPSQPPAPTSPLYFSFDKEPACCYNICGRVREGGRVEEEEEEEVDSVRQWGSEEGKGLFIRNLDVHLCSDTILHMSASSKWECGRQQVSSCLPLRDHKLCWETHTEPHTHPHTHTLTVLGELQHVVQQRRVSVEGPQPRQEDGARVRVVEPGRQGARRVRQLAAEKPREEPQIVIGTTAFNAGWRRWRHTHRLGVTVVFFL